MRKYVITLWLGMLLGSGAIAYGQIIGGAVGGSGITITNIPGGSNTQVQFNDSNAFGGDSAMVWNKATNVLTIGGTVTSNILILPALACPSGMTAPLTVDDTGTVAAGTCS